MKINEITLYNIGSYSGKNVIPLTSNKEKNIVLIGGKNGAGKTTLFDSIRLCLYGFRTFGYQLLSAAYKNQIIKLISDSAKIKNSSASAYVAIDIDLEDGQSLSKYILTRSWKLDSLDFESFSVKKDNHFLSTDEIEDFNNYLLNVIPPELFNLFFFDGEQIAEYFLSEGSGNRFRTAFLTLCGFDNFEIMQQNFSRHIKQKKTNDISDVYIESKKECQKLQDEYNSLESKIASVTSQISDINAKLSALAKEYSKKGGVSLEEWKAKFEETKAQEKIRESLNTEIRKLALEEIPYLILEPRLRNLSSQLLEEDQATLDKNTLDYIHLVLPNIVKKATKQINATVSAYQTAKLSSTIFDELKALANKEGHARVLNLSQADRDSLLLQIRYGQSLSPSNVLENRKKYKDSIEKSKQPRAEIESCSIQDIKTYTTSRTQFEELLSTKNVELDETKADFDALTTKLEVAKENHHKISSKLNEELKHNSIIDISARAILMLDDLLLNLISSKMSIVEKEFEHELNRIKQKEEFISRVKIDQSFNIHAYKTVKFRLAEIAENPKMLEDSNILKVVMEFIHQHNIPNLKDFLLYCQNASNAEQISSEIEVDKTRFSKGEKQVFIMALYWSIMTIAKIHVPFMIDTPFARIDSNHRKKISEYFFKELPGQVLIFSTDEEIIGESLDTIKANIGSYLLLENTDNNKTIIHPNSYFEEV